MKTLTEIIIQSNIEIAPGAYVLSFRRSFDFLPGQVIGLSATPQMPLRLYSIASGHQEPSVRILYTLKNDGKLTPLLTDLKQGDVIYHSAPMGKFVGDEKPAVWIATGTGIAPFASMLFSGLAKNKTLIFGNRSQDGLYFGDAFQQALGKNYFPCLSREAHPEAFQGRVTDFLKTQNSLNPEIPYYLCGSAEMVVDVRDLLIEKGIPFPNILAEIFF